MVRIVKAKTTNNDKSVQFLTSSYQRSLSLVSKIHISIRNPENADRSDYNLCFTKK
jgi:hypothetical protein